jgi:hypothetical protein
MLAIERIGDESPGDVAGERRRDRTDPSSFDQRDEEPIMGNGRCQAHAEEGGELADQEGYGTGNGHGLSLDP